MILVPDTNAWIAYSMDFLVTPEEGGPPVRVRRRGSPRAAAHASPLEAAHLRLDGLVYPAVYLAEKCI